MNKAASALGKLAKGKKKTISDAERKARAERLAKARESRWTEAARANAKLPRKKGK